MRPRVRLGYARGVEQSREGGFRGAVHERVAAVLAPQPRVAEIGARDQLDAEGRAVVTIPGYADTA